MSTSTNKGPGPMDPELEVLLDQAKRRLLNAVLYAAVTVVAVLGTVGQPHDWKAWVGYVFLTLITGYAKYSDGGNVVMPNRQEWTEEERKRRLGQERQEQPR